MPKFITHEPLANNWFNMNHTTGSGHLQPWATALTNREELLLLLVDRMEKDFLALSPKMRKAYGKEVKPRNRVGPTVLPPLSSNLFWGTPCGHSDWPSRLWGRSSASVRRIPGGQRALPGACPRSFLWENHEGHQECDTSLILFLWGPIWLNVVVL